MLIKLDLFRNAKHMQKVSNVIGTSVKHYWAESNNDNEKVPRVLIFVHMCRLI